MSEQRRYDRFLLEIEIDHHIKNDKQNASKTKTKNISASGICLTTEEPLIEGEEYVLRFTLPGQFYQIVVDGRVVWSKEYTSGNVRLFDNGIEFTNISKEQHDMIEDYRLGSVYET